MSNDGQQSSSQSNARADDPVQSDPLLVCLAMLTQILDDPVPLAALKTGFALDATGHVPRAAIPEVVARHGFQASWSRQSPVSLPHYALPVIATLIDGRAIIVRAVDQGQVTLLYAETGMQSHTVPVQALEPLLTGDVLIVRRNARTGQQQLTPLGRQAFSWFWDTMWRFRRFYYDAMVATVVANVLTLATVFFAMNVFNRVIPSQAYVSLWTLTIGVGIALVLEFAMRHLKGRLVDEGGKRADLAVNATLLREIMEVRLDARPQSVGIFASSMREFDALREFISSSLFVTIADLPFVFLFLALIWVIGGPLVILPAAVLPLIIIVSLLVQRRLMRAMRENMRHAGEKQSVLVEAMTNLEMLKAHNAQGYLQRRWEVSNAASAQSYLQIRKINLWVTGFTTSLQQLTSVGIIVMGVYMIHDQALTLGALIACNILATRTLMPLGQVVQLATRYQQARAALDTLDGLVRRPKDREHDKRYVVPKAYEGRLRAQDLVFSYPGEGAGPVVDQVSLQLDPGDRLAILGHIGCGKSTLLRLLSGLYRPSSGQVRIDDLDMGQIDPSELRNHFGYVGQDAQLFMGTVRDNLVLTDTWITDERIADVLKRLGLYSVIAAHPRGLDMHLSESGGGLSGGQRQLLTVARMMLRDPVYVFMDEPTANMDQDTEAAVISQLNIWLKGRTLIVATHRPQILSLANRLAIMRKGKIITQGPKDEVLRKLSENARQRRSQGDAGGKVAEARAVPAPGATVAGTRQAASPVRTTGTV